MEHHSRGTFKGSFGFVLAAAGSAVGLGNIWRFPYLAARDGGGLFLVVYIILALTFGFAMLTSEISIGRKTKQSPLTAYGKLSKRWGWIGIFSCVVPFLIMPYYCAIGGWVIKYFWAFLTGHGLEAAQDGYFSGFITGQYEPLIFLLIFLAACAIVIFNGVEKGIEQFSKILMPILVILVIGIAVYSLTLSHTNEAGQTVSGIDGLKVYLIPSFKGVTANKFFHIVVDALMQLFYSLSIAMGIMIAYGSYVPDRSNLSKSINQIELFDTVVAFLAGVMIIPAVYVFMGPDGMSTGPSLMFVSLPKIFAAMGPAGNIVGTIFFAMVLFAALTSGISIMEAVISSFMDKFKLSRKKATVIETAFALVIGVIVCLGYNLLYFELKLPNSESPGQILDVLDYISNYLMMPIIALATCILIGWVLKPDTVIEEVTKNGEPFRRKKLYTIMTRYISPIFIIVILLFSLGIL
ncbi:MAG: sodium-dependent transporter [Lachnospiraceae bacterium]|nr:sodium-dependent transporter [Lachnospiraceae bacterium]MBR7076969.1 sodium-dependent transporter [Lachnospiraceae bacterium]